MRRSLTLSSLKSFTTEQNALAQSRTAHGRKKERHDVSPSEYVIRNILNYSKALVMMKTNETGNVGMVMN